MSLIEEALRRTQQTAGQDAKPQDRPMAPAPVASPAAQVSQAKTATPLPFLPSQGGGRLRARIEKGLLAGGSALIAGIVIWEAWVYVAPAAGRLRRPVAAARPAGAQAVQTSFSPSMHRPLLQPTLRLSGIVGGPGEPLAIINGTIMRVGEMVAGATLLEVGEDFARLRWRDQDVVLRTGE
ncbi:MAG: hypothetical protein HY596_00495 [Candidatus Omnitrophica bacterium]|nr:hypothetical protein [Candidatus Omnitrophota bacterium]